MKKILALLLALAMVFALAACGQQAAPAASDGAPAASDGAPAASGGEETAKTWKIGYCFMTISDASIAQIKADAEKEAAALGVELVTSSCEMDAQKQISDVENMMTLGVDCIILQPMDAESLEPVLTEAMGKGIKVLCFGPEAPVYDLWYSISNEAAARACADEVGKYVNEKLGGEADVAYITLLNVKALVERNEAFYDELAKVCPGAKVVTEAYATDSTSGVDAIETILQQYPDIDIISCIGDGVALGVSEGLMAAGVSPDQCAVFSSDVTALGCQAILDPNNPMVCTMSYDSLVLGKNCIDYAVGLCDGSLKPAEGEKVMYYGIEPVDINNAQAFLDALNSRG